MDILAKLTCVEISIFILLYGWFVAKLTGAWSRPAVIYAVFWFGMTFLPLVAVPSAPADPMAMFYIFGTVVAFSVPALCYDWRDSLSIADARQNEKPASHRLLTSVFFAMQICAIVFVFVNLTKQGFSILDFIARPMHTAGEYLAARYEGRVQANLFSQSGIVLNYIAVALGGLVIAGQRHRYLAVAVFVFSFLPAVLHMMVYADKGTLFQSAAYFFGGVLVSRVARGDRSLINKQTLKVAALALAILAPLLVVAMLTRVGKGGNGMFYLRTYAFGHLYGFSDWFSIYFSGRGGYIDPDGATWGFWTFLAIGHQITPGTVVPPGYFSEYFEIPGVLRTNIYTMFRGLIYDFGVIGSWVFLALFGLIASVSYNSMLRRQAPVLGQSVFIFTLGFIYSSYLFSVLAWNSIYAAFLGVALVLAANGATHAWLSSYVVDAAKVDDARQAA